jgi:hypothetical protein
MPLAAPDYELLDAALFPRYNEVREQHGLPPFRYAAVLFEAASYHATTMISRNFYDHHNKTGAAYHTPDRRIRTFGGDYHVTAENIAQFPPSTCRASTVRGSSPTARTGTSTAAPAKRTGRLRTRVCPHVGAEVDGLAGPPGQHPQYGPHVPGLRRPPEPQPVRQPDRPVCPPRAELRRLPVLRQEPRASAR